MHGTKLSRETRPAKRGWTLKFEAWEGEEGRRGDRFAYRGAVLRPANPIVAAFCSAQPVTAMASPADEVEEEIHKRCAQLEKAFSRLDRMKAPASASSGKGKGGGGSLVAEKRACLDDIQNDIDECKRWVATARWAGCGRRLALRDASAADAALSRAIASVDG